MNILPKVRSTTRTLSLEYTLKPLVSLGLQWKWLMDISTMSDLLYSVIIFSFFKHVCAPLCASSMPLTVFSGKCVSVCWLAVVEHTSLPSPLTGLGLFPLALVPIALLILSCSGILYLFVSFWTHGYSQCSWVRESNTKMCKCVFNFTFANLYGAYITICIQIYCLHI